MTNYTQLSMQERSHLHSLYGMDFRVSDIAQRLGRHRSTIYRELTRNSDADGYSPSGANSKAKARKNRLCNIERFPTLRYYVTDKLKLGWSPEQIAGRLKRKKSKYAICHETIYRFIYKYPKHELYQYLAHKKRRRRRVHARQKPVCRFGSSRIITERPQSVEDRKRAGHWEGDSIEFSSKKQKQVTTLVERKTRMLMIIKNGSKYSNEVMTNIAVKFKSYPRIICKTVTFDQGGEFARFDVLEGELKCGVYYCHAHSPWEKGGNENMNGRLRRYLPRNTIIDNIDQKELDIIAKRMNTTPRKCLDYRTPLEMFQKHYQMISRTWV